MTKRILGLLLVLVLVGSIVPMAVADQTPASLEKPFPWLSDCEVDLTGETLTFYSIGDLSGSYAFITQPLLLGLTDAAEYMNANGGVCGAEVVLESFDTGGNQEQTQAFWDDVSAKEDANLVYLYASADGELLREQAAEKEVVLWNAAASELALYGETGEPGWQYTTIVLYVDQLGGFCDYVAANWESMGMEGDPVIGHLSWEGAFGRSSDTAGTQAYCESKGVGYAGAEYFLPGTPDISTQLQTLVDAGANIIYTTSLASGPAQVAGTIASMGLQDQLMMGGVNWALDTSVILLGGENVLGITGAFPYLWWDDIDNAGVQTVTGIWAEKRLAAAADPVDAIKIRGVGYLTAYGLLDMWAEAHIRTANRMGGLDGVTGAAIQETMQDFSYEAFNGLFAVDFSNGVRSGTMARMGRISPPAEGGQLLTVTPVQDWTKMPDLRSVGGADLPQ